MLGMCRINQVKQTSEATASAANKAVDKITDVVGQVVQSCRGRPSDKPKGVFGSTIVTIVEVFDAMHFAARGVLTTGVDETATCVEHKYDPTSV